MIFCSQTDKAGHRPNILRLILNCGKSGGRTVTVFLLAAVVLIPSVPAAANQLTVSDVSIVSRSSTAGTANIRFDLSWANSWRNRNNRDAVWLFAKYSTDGGLTWSHARMKTAGVNPSGVSTGSGTAINLTVSADKMGAFAERAADGNGNVAVTGAELVWDYQANGLNPNTTARVKVIGIEMVYVPEGAFFAGDQAVSEASFKQGSADTDPWSIASNSAISVNGAVSDGYYYQTAGNPGENGSGDSFSIPAIFPKGYSAFYVMKYEVSEGLWTAFFNTLSSAQKVNRDITGADGKGSDAMVQRNSVQWTSGAAVSDRENRACSFLSWMDGAAFADWAALRPMTELEFEKAARGKEVETVSGEFVWGNLNITAADAVSGAEEGEEVVLTENANAHFGAQSISGGDGSSGPLRSGVFATQESTKTQSGAAFYGAMEFGGNLTERVVTVGAPAGRLFAGTHGDGELTTRTNYEGNATNSDWPGIDTDSTRGVTGADGSGFRGGSWADASDRLRTSDRLAAAMTDASRQGTNGFRAARSAS